MLPLMAVPCKQNVRMRREKGEIYVMLKLGGISNVKLRSGSNAMFTLIFSFFFLFEHQEFILG